MNFNPREHLFDEAISRPDWLVSSERNNGLIFLDKNENNDPELRNANFKIFQKIFNNSISTYPDNSILYKKISDFINQSANKILLGAGSDGIIRSVFETFIEPGDKLLLTSPTFAMYEIYAKVYQANVERINYVSKDNKPYMSLDAIINFIKKSPPKLFCLPNPDSPTGTVFDPDEINKILQLSYENNVITLIDEAYFPFYDQTCMELTNKFENLIITRTFAKAWGLAGLRVGYGVASNNLIQYMHKIRAMYEINTLASNMICAAIDNYEIVEKSVHKLNEGKNWFIEKMNELNYHTWEAHGNFLHVNFGKDSNKIHKNLENKVLYRKNFSEDSLKGYSRFSSTYKDEFEKVYQLIKHK